MEFSKLGIYCVAGLCFLFIAIFQIRELADLSLSNPPGRVAITIPGCSEGEDLLCPLSKLRAIAIRAVDAECITPPEVRMLPRVRCRMVRCLVVRPTFC